MKTLLSLKNVVIAVLGCWTVYSTGLPNRALAVVSRAVENVQKVEICRLAGKVNELENKEQEVSDQIDSTERLTDIANGDDQRKLERRANHLKARQAQLFVKKGEVVNQIDELADSHRRVVEQRDVALNYAGSTESLVLKQHRSSPREPNFIDVRHFAAARVPAVFETAYRSRSSCR